MVQLTPSIVLLGYAKTASLYGFRIARIADLFFNHRIRQLALLLLLLTLSGCTSMVTSRLGNNLSLAIQNQDDPDTVRAGAPAYLLLIDSLITGDPKDRQILMAGARLYATYTAIFVEDNERAQRLSKHARDYARRAICLTRPRICELDSGAFLELLPEIEASRYEDIPALYTYALSLALWIQSHSSDWSAVAELPKVEAMLEQVVRLNSDYEGGMPQLYLGIIRSQLPPALGGKPERAREAFEEAIALSGGRNLMAKVEYARNYARLMFDRELHDRLLNEVLAAKPEEPGLTLSNVLAQQQAKVLLDSANDYF